MSGHQNTVAVLRQFEFSRVGGHNINLASTAEIGRSADRPYNVLACAGAQNCLNGMKTLF